MGRSRHPDKDIEKALVELEEMGWTVEMAKGRSAHAWGYALCPANAGDACRSGTFCRMSVWSTPRNPRAIAQGLVGRARCCVMKDDKDE
jgi:hypothetical protein